MGEEASETGGVAGLEVAGALDGGKEAEGGAHCCGGELSANGTFLINWALVVTFRTEVLKCSAG